MKQSILMDWISVELHQVALSLPLLYIFLYTCILLPWGVKIKNFCLINLWSVFHLESQTSAEMEVLHKENYVLFLEIAHPREDFELLGRSLLLTAATTLSCL